MEQEDPSYYTQKMPPFWKIYSRLFGFTAFSSILLIAWLDNWIYALIPCTVALICLVHMYYFVRCPRCARRLSPRTAKKQPDSERYLYDCPECKITWDPHLIFDPPSA